MLMVGVIGMMEYTRRVHQLRSGNLLANSKRAHLTKAGDIYTLPMSLMELWQIYVDIEMGTPPQTISLVIDSSSQFSFIPSVNCLTPQCTGMSLNGFDQSQSSTFQTTNQPVSLTTSDYVASTDVVTGIKATDMFMIGPNNFSSDFCLVTNTRAEHPDQLMYNGRFGFGFSGPDFPNPCSLLPGVFQGLPNKIISFYLQMEYSSFGLVGGMEIGGMNQDLLVPGSLVTLDNYAPDSGLWAVRISNVVIGGAGLGMNGYGQVDTSIPFLIMPVTNFVTISAIIDFEGHGGVLVKNTQENNGLYYKIPCSAMSNLPTVSLIIGDLSFQIPPDIYLIGDGTNCISLFHGLNIQNMWILGIGLHRGKMVAFDYERGTISFGKLK